MRLLSILLLSFVVLLSFTGCEEQLLQRYLLNYGIDVRGEQYTLEELRLMLKEARAEAAREQIDSAEVESAPVPEFSCAALEDTVPRGLACLHCMHPEARTQAGVLTTLLHRSCLKNVAVNYLVDGTFSFDDRVLENHITLLSDNGRQLFLYFYITNGPAQRRWQGNSYRTLGSKTSPQQFRKLIVSNEAVQAEYRYLVSRLIPTILYAQSRGAVISIIPMLEDNLDNQAFETMAELTLDTLPAGVHVAIGRSPCPSCYDGNTRSIPEGVFEEAHTVSLYSNVEDGVISNDGHTYADSQYADEGSFTLSDLTGLRDHAARLNSTFILWNAKRQGLGEQFSGGTLPDPDYREYPIPSIAERRELLRFLRGQ